MRDFVREEELAESVSNATGSGPRIRRRRQRLLSTAKYAGAVAARQVVVERRHREVGYGASPMFPA